MAYTSKPVEAHQEWLGLLQPIGLLVAPPALVRRNAILKTAVAALQQTLRDRLTPDKKTGYVEPLSFTELVTTLLDWDLASLAGAEGGPPLPEELVRRLPDYDETLRPDLAAIDPVSGAPIVLVRELPPGAELDEVEAKSHGWKATPHQKLERLLRETEVPVGILFAGDALRLVYAPRGESSGYGTWSLAAASEVLNRELLSALELLLSDYRVFGAPDGERLTDLLRESREYQNEVSTKLAEQVLGALWELLGGFQSADALSRDRVVGELAREAPEELYEGLLAVMMRLVFLLYSEEQDLMPDDPVYAEHYAVGALFEKLRNEAAEHVDTMDQRYGAWARLLTLFRLIHDGGRHGELHFPPRAGRIFDPDSWPFLEGRPRGVLRVMGESIDAPKISDGCVHRVLERLLILDGERLSYRTLDVEQIGSVYEAMMGFRVEEVAGRAVAVKPKSSKANKTAHVVVDLDELLSVKPAKRKKWLSDAADCDVTGKSSAALKSAETPDDLVAALGRKVSPRTPHVLAPGSLVLQPTEERRRSGSHYTPRELSAPIVQRTLEPLLKTIEATHGAPATATQICSLKVCDPAMGSGAFLVESCRYLADRVVEAWDRDEETPGIVARHGDALTHARRLVAQQCLYGVDKNPAAVDLAKLSLWLITLSRDEPFTFLDHSLRHGDSLVGLSLDQLRAFHWSKGETLGLTAQHIKRELDRAQEIRERIVGLADSHGLGARKQKEELLREALDAIDDARLIGDVCVGAFFSAKGKRDRENERQRRLELVRRWLEESDAGARLELDALRVEIRERIPVFHWMLEFPEVFYLQRADPLEGGKVNRAAFMDAFVGNPPFLGHSGTEDALGSGYRPWLMATNEDSGGKADLCAFFFRRADALLGTHGAAGLIATNTIGQGDTRESGLKQLVARGATIYSATPNRPWPGAGAAVHVAVVHFGKGHVQPMPRTLVTGSGEERLVEAISSRLRGKPERPDPQTLSENAGFSHVGAYVLGTEAFTFDDTKPGANSIDQLDQIRRYEPASAELIRAFIGGEEINSTPELASHRYVIDLGVRSESDSRAFPALMSILENKSKPLRATNKRARYRDYWWQFGEPQTAMRRSIAPLDRCLVNSQVSKHLVFAWQPTDRVFAHTLYVYPVEHDTFFAVVQSRIHERWARLLSSSMKSDLRYTPSDCFETFPFPETDPRAVIPSLEELGARLYEARAAYMQDPEVWVGLTETYNRLKDPEQDEPRIRELRAMHEELDRAVLSAYGWDDLHELVPPFCIATDEHRAQLEAFEDEVLDRLFVLNEERAAEEKRALKVRTKRSSKNKRGRSSGDQGTLDLGGEE